MKHTRRDFLGAFASAGAMAGPLAAQQPSADQIMRAELIAGARLPDALRAPARSPAVLPLGSIEYHGPGAALGTDALLGSGLGERVCRRLGRSKIPAVLFPAVVYSQAPAHTRAFRGTISVRPEAVTMYLHDILEGISAMGFQRVLVLNAHDGNIGPGRAAVFQIANEKPLTQFLFLNWWEAVPGPLVDSLHLFTQGNGGHGHGGPLELSSAAAVNPAALIRERGPDLPAPPDISAGFPYYLAKSSSPDWPGYSGKVSEASAEKGEKIIGLAAERIAALVERWIANAEIPGNW